MITDRRRLGQDAEAALIRRISVAAQAGIHIIQVRERDMADRALMTLVRRSVDAVRGTRARVLVNDRVDVAIAAGAHGVHLRGDSAPAARVRAITPPTFLIGRSVHSAGEISRVVDEACVDYLIYGTVFDTASKPGISASGVAGLSQAVKMAGRFPVLAVGGVKKERVGQLAATGCAGFAAIGEFADHPEEDLTGTVTSLLHAWENPR
jgi:thiamine-phosphate pyrophosphorylase